MWSRDYVRMPCSPQSLYPVEEVNHVLCVKFDSVYQLVCILFVSFQEDRPILKNRWDLINASLSKPINNSYELEEAILEYNSKYRTIWKFVSLHKLFNEVCIYMYLKYNIINDY